MRYRYFEELKELLNYRVILSVLKKSIKRALYVWEERALLHKARGVGSWLPLEDALITGLARAGSQTQHLLRYCV